MGQRIKYNNQIYDFPDNTSKEEIINYLKKQKELNNPIIQEKNLYNAPIETLKRSGGQFVKDVITPFTQPIKTAKSILELGKSVSNLLFVKGEQENEILAKQVGEFFKERYGGLENIKKTFRTDPVGFAADLSLLVSGGAMLPARASGVVGQTSKAVGQAGKIIDPLILTSKITKNLALKPLGKIVAGGLGWTTGAGSKAIKTAYGAGYAQGDKARAFSEGRVNSPNRAIKIQENLNNELNNLKLQYRNRWKNSKAGKKMDNIKIPVAKVNEILNKIEKNNKINGRWVEQSDKILFDTVSSIKKEILKSNKRRNATNVDDIVAEVNDLLRNNSNNSVLLDTKFELQNLISEKMPNYKKLTQGFDEISNAQQTLKQITNKNDADKILKNVQTLFSKNVDAPVLAKNLEIIDKNTNLNLAEVGAGKSMSKILPTADNLVTQGIKIAGFGLTGGPLGPFSPQGVGRYLKTAGATQRYGGPLLANALRGNRALQQKEDDTVYY